jgi:two-component system response regulator FimZ (fimbrial Z protein)
MPTVIVEDQEFLREVLSEICKRDLRHDLVLSAGDGAEGLRMIVANNPGLVLLDLEMPKLEGFAVIELARSAGLNPRFLVFSSFLDDFTIYCVEKAKVSGFIGKRGQGIESLRHAISAVESGGLYFSPEFAELRDARHRDPAAFDKILSEREISVLRHLGELESDADIGAALEMAEATAAKHRYNIGVKLRLSPMELVRYARHHGFRAARTRPSNLR